MGAVQQLLLAQAAAAGGAGTTWNPADLSNVTLSNGNLTAAATAATTGGVRGVASNTTGKYYFEATFVGTLANSGVGVATAAANLGTANSTASLCAFVNINNGAMFVNGSNAGSATSFGGIVSGSVICVAVDLVNKRIWWRRDSGIWNVTGTSADPATNVGGVDISALFASAAAYPLATFPSTGLSYTVNFGQSAFAGAVPAGFTAGWPAPSLVLATFDGVATNVTLSNGNLTATHNSSATNSGARSLTLLNTGKRYFEVTIGASHGNNDSVAVVTGATSYTSVIGGGGGAIAFNGSSAGPAGFLYWNGTNPGKAIGAWAPGDVICCAVDFTTAYFWFRRNGGNWNGDAAANPVTAAGGLGPGTIGGTAVAPTLSFGGTATAINDNMTLNCGQTAYAFTPPTGFGNWGV